MKNSTIHIYATFFLMCTLQLSHREISVLLSYIPSLITNYNDIDFSVPETINPEDILDINFSTYSTTVKARSVLFSAPLWGYVIIALTHMLSLAYAFLSFKKCSIYLLIGICFLPVSLAGIPWCEYRAKCNFYISRCIDTAVLINELKLDTLNMHKQVMETNKLGRIFISPDKLIYLARGRVPASGKERDAQILQTSFAKDTMMHYWTIVSPYDIQICGKYKIINDILTIEIDRNSWRVCKLR